MRFAHVRVAAATLLSGVLLTFGALGTAPAALAAPANTSTGMVCQVLPPSATPTPSASPSPFASPSPSPSPSPSAGSSTASDAAQTAAPGAPSGSDQATSPAQSASGAATLDAAGTVGSSTATTAPAELCVSVAASQSSIKRGQTATYVVQVSTKNGSASAVSVALTAQPSSQKPAFSSGCAQGDGTASCGIGSINAGQVVSVDAQIAVPANATSVSSVALTATANAATSTKWTPPAAAATTAVTAAKNSATAKNSAKKAKSSAKNSATSSGNASRVAALPLGPIPALQGESSTLIGPGNAASLFPTIARSPSASPQPTAATQSTQPSERNTASKADASPASLGTPVFTAQAAGLIALGLAIMLTVTRLWVRKRRPGRPRG